MPESTRSSDKSLSAYGLFALAILTWYLSFLPVHPLKTFQWTVSGFVQARWETSVFIRIWGGHLWFVAGYGLLLSVLLGVGVLIGRVFPVAEDEEADEPGAWAWALAFGILSAALLATGLALVHLLKREILLSVLGTVLIALIRREGWGLFRRAMAPLTWIRDWPFSWKLAACAVAIPGMAGLLAPEMSWDALTHQLNLPLTYLREGGFYFAERNPPAQAPALGQMMHVWGLALGDDRIARAVHFAAYLATAGFLFSAGCRRFGPTAGMMAAFLYGTIPFLWTHSIRGYVDHFTTLFAVLGLATLWVRMDREGSGAWGRGELAASCVMLGALGGFKYNAPAYWAAALVLLSVGTWTRRWGWRWIIALGMAILFFTAPWLLKNAAATGNPVYPYLAGWFPTSDWSAFDARAAAVKFPVEGWGGLWRAPAVFYGAFFKNQGGAVNEDLGSLALLLSPLLVMRATRPAGIGGLLGTAGILLVPWLMTSPQVRLAMAVIALVALALGAAWARALEAWKSRRDEFVLGAAFVAGLQALSLAWCLVQQSNPLPHVSGLVSRSSYLGAVLRPEGHLVQSEALDRALPPGARLLWIGPLNTYYANRYSIYDYDHVEPALKVWVREVGNAEGLWRQFLRRGVTHLVYHAPSAMGSALRARELGLERYGYSDRELRIVETFFLHYTRPLPLAVVGGYVVYEIGRREGYSALPPYLPGTEAVYLEALRKSMGLASVSDLAGIRLGPQDLARAYPLVNQALPGLGLAWFQTGATLSREAGDRYLVAARRGLESSGDRASWMFLRGNHALNRGFSRAAVPLLEEAVRLAPERADATSNLAVAYYNVRLHERALAMMERAATLEPGNPEYAGIVRQWQASLAPGK